MQAFNESQFGEYFLHDRIGAGGMAEIFLATSRGIEGFEKRLVIKRILPTLSDDAQFVRMFIEEAKLCVSLRHPNIVQVYDLGEIEGQYFIAMEYIDGRDLLKTLSSCGRKQVGFPTEIALFIIMEVLKGLDYAHNLTRPDGQPLNIIHRDVSPSNVLLSFEGEVKISDFGIAKASTREKTATGILKGKFGYMAPEQVTGAPIDHRADIFAIGIMLYELLTGHRLFAGKNDLAVLEKVRDARIDPQPHFYRPDLDEEIEEITLRALSRVPADRFQSAAELHDAIHDYVFRCGATISPSDLARFMQALFLSDADEIERRRKARLPPVLLPAPRTPSLRKERGQRTAGERPQLRPAFQAEMSTPSELARTPLLDLAGGRARAASAAERQEGGSLEELARWRAGSEEQPEAAFDRLFEDDSRPDHPREPETAEVETSENFFDPATMPPTGNDRRPLRDAYADNVVAEGRTPSAIPLYDDAEESTDHEPTMRLDASSLDARRGAIERGDGHPERSATDRAASFIPTARHDDSEDLPTAQVEEADLPTAEIEESILDFTDPAEQRKPTGDRSEVERYASAISHEFVPPAASILEAVVAPVEGVLDDTHEDPGGGPTPKGRPENVRNRANRADSSDGNGGGGSLGSLGSTTTRPAKPTDTAHDPLSPGAFFEAATDDAARGYEEHSEATASGEMAFSTTEMDHPRLHQGLGAKTEPTSPTQGGPQNEDFDDGYGGRGDEGESDSEGWRPLSGEAPWSPRSASSLEHLDESAGSVPRITGPGRLEERGGELSGALNALDDAGSFVAGFGTQEEISSETDAPRLLSELMPEARPSPIAPSRSMEAARSAFFGDTTPSTRSQTPDEYAQATSQSATQTTAETTGAPPKDGQSQAPTSPQARPLSGADFEEASDSECQAPSAHELAAWDEPEGVSAPGGRARRRSVLDAPAGLPAEPDGSRPWPSPSPSRPAAPKARSHRAEPPNTRAARSRRGGEISSTSEDASRAIVDHMIVDHRLVPPPTPEHSGKNSVPELSFGPTSHQPPFHQGAPITESTGPAGRRPLPPESVARHPDVVVTATSRGAHRLVVILVMLAVALAAATAVVLFRSRQDQSITIAPKRPTATADGGLEDHVSPKSVGAGADADAEIGAANTPDGNPTTASAAADPAANTAANTTPATDNAHSRDGGKTPRRAQRPPKNPGAAADDAFIRVVCQKPADLRIRGPVTERWVGVRRQTIRVAPGRYQIRLTRKRRTLRSYVLVLDPGGDILVTCP
ncbi:MAG: protein kinase [Deltaproteobacteria bacterium]|nr:protein kinase [Deltaproteobacteria bacterium]